MNTSNDGSDLPTVRAIASADLAALKAVIASTELFPPELLDDMVASFLGPDETGDRWLTLDDGEPTAVAYYAPERLTSGTWSLYLIAVRADRQARGYGSFLLDHIERELAARAGRVLIVETSGLPTFERARAFYERCGYEREARIRDFYQAGDDKIVFWKSLQAPRLLHRSQPGVPVRELP